MARLDAAFAIDETEAKALAEAICNYLRHTRYRMDPRTRDLGALILTVLAIEGPRCARALSHRKIMAAQAKAEAQAQAQAGGRVVPMDHPGLRGV